MSARLEIVLHSLPLQERHWILGQDTIRKQSYQFSGMILRLWHWGVYCKNGNC